MELDPADPATRDRPHLRLVRGDASPEEIAALVAVLTARAAAAAASGSGSTPEAPVSAWADPRPAMRQYPGPEPGAWQRSGYTPGVRTRADW